MNPDPADGFILDERLAADTMAVARLGLCDVLLMNDSRFPWLILVPRRANRAELIDLDAGERAMLTEEIAAASKALGAITGCDKLNVGALGNMVRQLHVHVVARFETDAAWPGPVWGFGKAVAYEAKERDRLLTAFRAALSA